MKIAVVGCGALGSYYGARLCRDGHEVHFLLRSDFDAVRRRGLRIQSPEGNFHVRPRCAREASEIGPADLVLIGLKTTANGEFPRLLPPLVGPHTAVLTLQNGLGNEEALSRLFPTRQILGGLCVVCLNRLEPGLVHHIAQGKIILGEHAGWPEPRTHDLASMFRRAGVPCEVTDSLAAAHWRKLVWNIPFNGYGVASSAGIEAVSGDGELAPGEVRRGPCLTTDRLLGDSRWSALVQELMLEVIRVARALGHSIEDGFADAQIRLTLGVGAYRASTLVDFERGSALELESLFVEPLRQARLAGVATPRLTALVRVLSRLDPGPGQHSGS